MKDKVHKNNDYFDKRYDLYSKRYDRLKTLIDQVNHYCEQESELKYRVDSIGRFVYVYQCKICGRQIGGAIKKEVALGISININKFEESVNKKYLERYNKLRMLLHKISQKMKSLENKIKGIENKVFEEKISTLVQKGKNSNKLIEKFYLEFLDNFNLGETEFWKQLNIYVRNKIVSENLARDNTNLFKSEDEVTEWFIEYFNKDFKIYHQAKGIHLLEKDEVKIDILLIPRKHLVEKGFIYHVIGVELKYIDPQSDSLISKANESLAQTISYTNCKFEIEGKFYRPKFCMIFSNLSFCNEKAIFREFPVGYNERIWFNYLLLANKLNVGEINIYGNRDINRGWSFNFGNTGVYFKKVDDFYKLVNENVILKNIIGNMQ